MAVDITLTVRDKNGEKDYDNVPLYFGKALNCRALWDGWNWAKSQKLTIDGPWELDNKNAVRGCLVTKDLIKQWIEEGYLSRDPKGEDNTYCFLDLYPDDSTLRLWMVDWS